tara:strand:- start:343 stop:654 length:312 start_codon:yes stop_codon:yes gene_type:complete
MFEYVKEILYYYLTPRWLKTYTADREFEVDLETTEEDMKIKKQVLKELLETKAKEWEYSDEDSDECDPDNIDELEKFLQGVQEEAKTYHTRSNTKLTPKFGSR